MHGGRTGGDDALLELDDLPRTGLVLARAVGHFHLDMVRVEEGAVAAHDVDLAPLGHAGETAGQLADDLVLVRAQLVDVDLRRGEADAEGAGVPRFLHDRGDVQQGLGRNAADVEADAAERRVAFDDDRLHAEVGRAEGRRVAAGAGAEDEHLAFHVGTAAVAGRGRGNHLGHRRRGFRFCRIFRVDRGSSARFDLDQQRTLADLGTELHQHFPDHAGDRAGHVHRRLVGFQRGDRVVDLDAVADFHEQVDDRDV